MPNFVDNLLDEVFPPYASCSVCDGPAPGNLQLCAFCQAQLVDAPVDRLRAAAYLYEGPAAIMAKRLKFAHQTHFAKPLALAMAERLNQSDWQADVLVPVPLHWFRAWRRGFNQAELLAQELSKLCGLPVLSKALRRTRKTTPQAKLSRERRLTNLLGAFCANPKCNLEGLRIVLIDDVCTTGATASECFQALRAAGAQKVYLLTACATPLD